MKHFIFVGRIHILLISAISKERAKELVENDSMYQHDVYNIYVLNEPIDEGILNLLRLE